MKENKKMKIAVKLDDKISPRRYYEAYVYRLDRSPKTEREYYSLIWDWADGDIKLSVYEDIVDKEPILVVRPKTKEEYLDALKEAIGGSTEKCFYVRFKKVYNAMGYGIWVDNKVGRRITRMKDIINLIDLLDLVVKKIKPDYVVYKDISMLLEIEADFLPKKVEKIKSMRTLWRFIGFYTAIKKNRIKPELIKRIKNENIDFKDIGTHYLYVDPNVQHLREYGWASDEFWWKYG